MSDTEARQRDVLSMAVAIQLSLFAVVMPSLFGLVLVSALITLNVLANEAIRRLDAYAEQ